MKGKRDQRGDGKKRRLGRKGRLRDGKKGI